MQKGIKKIYFIRKRNLSLFRRDTRLFLFRMQYFRYATHCAKRKLLFAKYFQIIEFLETTISIIYIFICKTAYRK